MGRNIILLFLAAASVAATPAIAQTGPSLVRKLFSDLESALRQDGKRFSRVEEFSDVLTDGGRSDLHVIRLQAGAHYGVVGFCDEHCSDLDLEAWSADGRSVASDVGPDDQPLLDIVATVGGDYTVRTTMADCQSARCASGLRVYRWD